MDYINVIMVTTSITYMRERGINWEETYHCWWWWVIHTTQDDDDGSKTLEGKLKFVWITLSLYAMNSQPKTKERYKRAFSTSATNIMYNKSRESKPTCLWNMDLIYSDIKYLIWVYLKNNFIFILINIGSL